jgi:hypothetical protein
MAWMQHEDPTPDVPWSTWGLYLYDGVIIRRRHAPAAIASVEVPAGPDGPDRITARLRDTGYSVEPWRPRSGGDKTLLIG